MTTQSNTMSDRFEAQPVAPAVLSPTQPMYWSVRRELWENRSIYIAPLAAAAVFLIGFLISLFHLPQSVHMSTMDATHQRAAVATPQEMAAGLHAATVSPYDMAAGLMMLTAMVVGAFYCLEALHSERRDRSILFWKSMPVSDLTTVLSKASIPFVVLPLLTFAITVVMQLIMLLLSSAVLWANGMNAETLWTQLSFFQMSLFLLYHLVTVHVLWHAPFYSWLLLVSSWARRFAILWATLPLLAIGVFEKLVFHTSHFGMMLENRLDGAAEAITMPGTMPMNPMTHLTPGVFLISPGLWLGLAFSAVCLGAAIQIRRYRGPI